MLSLRGGEKAGRCSTTLRDREKKVLFAGMERNLFPSGGVSSLPEKEGPSTKGENRGIRNLMLRIEVRAKQKSLGEKGGNRRASYCYLEEEKELILEKGEVDTRAAQEKRLSSRRRGKGPCSRIEEGDGGTMCSMLTYVRVVGRL